MGRASSLAPSAKVLGSGGGAGIRGRERRIVAGLGRGTGFRGAGRLLGADLTTGGRSRTGGAWRSTCRSLGGAGAGAFSTICLPGGRTGSVIACLISVGGSCRSMGVTQAAAIRAAAPSAHAHRSLSRLVLLGATLAATAALQSGAGGHWRAEARSRRPASASLSACAHESHSAAWAGTCLGISRPLRAHSHIVSSMSTQSRFTAYPPRGALSSVA